jgi:lactoylglutathione lyase
MRLGYTIIYVKNIEETIAFYDKAFGMKQSFAPESGMYGEVETESGTKLGFVSSEFVASSDIDFTRNNKADKAPGFVICLITDDVEAAYNKACAAGAEGVKDPHDKPWGQVVALVRDNNGVFVEICTEVKE